MINIVTGLISPNDLGLTLMHEHIVVDITGAEKNLEKPYTVQQVVDYVLPYLKEAKEHGLNTIVEATPLGLGRDLQVLVECSKRSGIKIVTCTGAWDGSDVRGLSVPENLKKLSIDEIADIWIKEFSEGIEGTGIKPGYIKLALGDEGKIFPLQEKLLRAGARASKKTGMFIACHIWEASSLPLAIKILEEENLPYNKFIWVHADGQMNMDLILEYGKKGIWLEFDSIGTAKNFEKFPDALRILQEEGLTSQLLFGQDSGSFWIKDEEEDWPMRPYARFFTEFIPYCKTKGFEEEFFLEILRENSRKILTIH